MTPNIAGPIFQTLAWAFFVAVFLGALMAAYAGAVLKKHEKESPSAD
jgi:hypothetical protein